MRGLRDGRGWLSAVCLGLGRDGQRAAAWETATSSQSTFINVQIGCRRPALQRKKMGTQRDSAHPDSPPPPSPVTSRRPYSPLCSIQDGPVVRVGGGGVGYSGSGGEGFGSGGVGSGGARGG